MRRRRIRSTRGPTLWAACLAAALTAPAPAAAGEPLYVRFAKCAGRLSAEMEHRWLVRTASPAAFEAQRAALIDITDALVPAGDETRALALRIESKFAHRTLLMRAHFNEDPGDARWAAHRAERALSSCVGLLLS